jgi:uncharacterized protein (UPF0276 family)
VPALSTSRVPSSMPLRAGVGLKAEHYQTILDTQPDVGFFEVHAENYMGLGGPPHRYLSAIAEIYPISLHGVGLSIGGSSALDKNHLRRLRHLLERYSPALFSEHLAWSTHDTCFFHDLLPLPYTSKTLWNVCDHIDEVQSELGRQMLLENPSTYLAFSESTYSEIEFIAEIVKRTGCGLLLEQWDTFSYIDSFPLDKVQEIHLAGHMEEVDERDQPLLIDTHDRPVSELVWRLFEHTIEQTGALPTLIEWDAALPAWAELQTEVQRAEGRMSLAALRKPSYAVL